MIFLIILFIVVVLVIGCAAFILLPSLLDNLVDAYDEWKEVFARIRRRINR